MRWGSPVEDHRLTFAFLRLWIPCEPGESWFPGPYTGPFGMWLPWVWYRRSYLTLDSRATKNDQFVRIIFPSRCHKSFVVDTGSSSSTSCCWLLRDSVGAFMGWVDLNNWSDIEAIRSAFERASKPCLKHHSCWRTGSSSTFNLSDGCSVSACALLLHTWKDKMQKRTLSFSG